MSSWAYPRTTKQSNSNWFTFVCTSFLNLHVGQGYAQTSLTSNCKSNFVNHPHPLDHMPTTALSTTCFAVLSHWTPWSSKGRTFHRPEKGCENFEAVKPCQFFRHLWIWHRQVSAMNVPPMEPKCLGQPANIRIA